MILRVSLFLAVWVSMSLGAVAGAQELGPSEAPATLGLALPLTGDFGPVGRQLARASKMAAEEVSIRLVVEDTEGTPEGAIRAIATLNTIGADAVIGPLGHRETMAAAALAQRNGFPMFTLGGDRRVETSKGWVFRARLSAAEHGSSAAENAYENHGSRRAGVVHPENEFGRAATVAFISRFKALGGTVESLGSYPEDATNFTWHLKELVGESTRAPEKAKAAGLSVNREGYVRGRNKGSVSFDSLFIPDSHVRVVRVLAFLPGVGIQNGESSEGTAVTLLGVSSWRGSSMRLSKGRAAGAFILDTFPGESGGGRAEEFDRTYQEVTGRKASSIEAEVFDLTWMLGTLSKGLDATLSMEERRRELVRALPRDRTWNGVAGSLRFSEDGAPLRGMVELRFDTDGHVVPTQ